MNKVVALVRKKMDGVKANKLAMRLGNCVTESTYNARDVDAMLEEVDADGDGRISYEEFLALYAERRSGGTPRGVAKQRTS